MTMKMLGRIFTQSLRIHNGLEYRFVSPIPSSSRLLRTSSCACQKVVEPQIVAEDPPLPIQQDLPIMTTRNLKHTPPNRKSKQAWLETLSTIDNQKLGLLDLHPDIFGAFPRLDILWWNVFWQQRYKHIDYRVVRLPFEMPGGGRKPWPQKGTGRARHGSIRSPLWVRGGKSFGPRGPKSFFFMLPVQKRVLGLRVALSCKYAQDGLHVVDSLDLPNADPSYLEELVESRGWGLSVLFVDDTDYMPKNIALATDEIKPYNLMPVYGLNVYSLLKHETVVLTLRAVEKLEEKLLYQMHKSDHREKPFSRAEWRDRLPQQTVP